MSLKLTYAIQSLEGLRNDPARRFLSDVGLPAENLLFGFAQPLARQVKEDGGERKFIRVGEGGDDEEFCVDVETGEVVCVNLADSSVWHVSESPEKFLACLEEFMSRYPYGGSDSELEDREVMANALKEALFAIDATAFDEDPGYWYTILGDVAIGDYSDE
ncbi:SUKH-4 family immunity protein [Streptomyces pseudogriseolus]|uniref:SUKH-4 family immunity protein n=1 Tax=Streptomyces pseudogriseolus TaxID=36817 RepID=UPI003FA2797B